MTYFISSTIRLRLKPLIKPDGSWYLLWNFHSKGFINVYADLGNCKGTSIPRVVLYTARSSRKSSFVEQRRIWITGIFTTRTRSKLNNKPICSRRDWSKSGEVSLLLCSVRSLSGNDGSGFLRYSFNELVVWFSCRLSLWRPALWGKPVGDSCCFKRRHSGLCPSMLPSANSDILPVLSRS